MPPHQTITRLERHPAPARLAPVDHPPRPHLHPRPQALPRLSKSGSRGEDRVQLVEQLLDLALCLAALGRGCGEASTTRRLPTGIGAGRIGVMTAHEDVADQIRAL